MFELDHALRQLRVIADKPERMRCFHKIVFEIGLEDPQRFWDEFWGIWTGSENLFDDFEFFEELVDHGLELGSPHLGLEKKEQAALRKLPPVITIYRGCIEHNQEGWSWTTDREKARWFANRAFGADERQVLKGTVRKEDVLGYLMGRGESEIVVRPEDVMDIEVDEEFVNADKQNGIYWAIQSGRDIFGNNEQMEKMKAQMVVSRMQNITDEQIADIQHSLDFAEWGDLKSKKTYLQELVKLMKMKQRDPASVPKWGDGQTFNM